MVTTRWVPLVVLALTTGCFPTYRHTVSEVFKEPLRADKGALAVVAADGSRDTFEAPYAVQPLPGGVRVSTRLLPSKEYDSTQIRHLETRRFSALGTAAVVAGAVGLVGASVWLIIAAEVALRGASLLGHPRSTGWL